MAEFGITEREYIRAAASTRCFNSELHYPHSDFPMETSLHRDLKLLYAGDAAQTEVRLGRYRVDALVGDLLVEVQHGSLSAIRDKIRQLCTHHRVLVVKPVVVRKSLVRLARADGPVVSRRLSPKRGTLVDLFHELVYFTRAFPHPNLAIEAVAVEVEEWRVSGPWPPAALAAKRFCRGRPAVDCRRRERAFGAGRRSCAAAPGPVAARVSYRPACRGAELAALGGAADRSSPARNRCRPAAGQAGQCDLLSPRQEPRQPAPRRIAGPVCRSISHCLLLFIPRISNPSPYPLFSCATHRAALPRLADGPPHQ